MLKENHPHDEDGVMQPDVQFTTLKFILFQ